MKRGSEKTKANQPGKPEPVSLAPLDTDQAITALLAIKPSDKPEKKKPIRGKTAKPR